MSWCRHGGKDVLERPTVREYDMTPAIRGRIVYKNGTESRITFSRKTKDGIREVSHVEIDGVCYCPEDFSLVEHFENGIRYAIDLDGIRYVKAPERDFDSEVTD